MIGASPVICAATSDSSDSSDRLAFRASPRPDPLESSDYVRTDGISQFSLLGRVLRLP